MHEKNPDHGREPNHWIINAFDTLIQAVPLAHILPQFLEVGLSESDQEKLRETKPNEGLGWHLPVVRKV